MIKIKILSVGKQKHKWLEEALKEYELRLKSKVKIEWVLCKNDEQLTQLSLQEKRIICLDPLGKEYTSTQFATFIEKEMDQFGPRIAFVIGGAEGLNLELKNKACHLVSFSKLTFTHQIARLILIEQLYRSFEILSNSPYHK